MAALAMAAVRAAARALLVHDLRPRGSSGLLSRLLAAAAAKLLLLMMMMMMRATAACEHAHAHTAKKRKVPIHASVGTPLSAPLLLFSYSLTIFGSLRICLPFHSSLLLRPRTRRFAGCSTGRRTSSVCRRVRSPSHTHTARPHGPHRAPHHGDDISTHCIDGPAAAQQRRAFGW